MPNQPRNADNKGQQYVREKKGKTKISKQKPDPGEKEVTQRIEKTLKSSKQHPWDTRRYT